MKSFKIGDVFLAKETHSLEGYYVEITKVKEEIQNLYSYKICGNYERELNDFHNDFIDLTYLQLVCKECLSPSCSTIRKVNYE